MVCPAGAEKHRSGIFQLRLAGAASGSLSRLRGQDVQATLAELTAVTISEQVLLSGGCERLLVCGGGARNPLLMARLAALLPGTEVSTTDEAGISGDDMEALAFAWLAWRTIAGLPGNLPSVTGASEATVLGAIFPANPPQNRS